MKKLLSALLVVTMMLSFAKMVRGEQKNPYSYEYELDLFKTILKCCE